MQPNDRSELRDLGMLRSRIRHLVRETAAGQSLGRVCARLYRERPVEDLPGWIGMVTGVKLPRRVRPSVAPDARTGADIAIIFDLLGNTADIEGDVAECGVFQGDTLIPIALYARQHTFRKAIFGFDSFQGFGESIDADLILGGEALAEKRRTGFGQTSLRRVQRKIEAFGVAKDVRLIAGYFDATLHAVADRKFSFVHLDCDLYSSYQTCLDFFYPRLSRGGVILLDEYNDPCWLGCNKAVDEFLRTTRARLLEIVRNNHVKYYLCKT